MIFECFRNFKRMSHSKNKRRHPPEFLSPYTSTKISNLILFIWNRYSSLERFFCSKDWVNHGDYLYRGLPACAGIIQSNSTFLSLGSCFFDRSDKFCVLFSMFFQIIDSRLSNTILQLPSWLTDLRSRPEMTPYSETYEIWFFRTCHRFPRNFFL